MLSIGMGDRLETSKKLVETLRTFGPRKLPILAGGASVMGDVELKQGTGVDFVTSDLAGALEFCGFGTTHPSDLGVLPLAAQLQE
jgi:methylmalonyl-CoA mutase cobalamin-binding subunit